MVRVGEEKPHLTVTARNIVGNAEAELALGHLVEHHDTFLPVVLQERL